MEEVTEPSNCRFCGSSFIPDKEGAMYCSIDCGYKDKMCNKYHCPICNEVTFSLDNDPYCSANHREQAMDKYEFTSNRTCDNCGSIFYGNRYDYLCSDYCENNDNYGLG